MTQPTLGRIVHYRGKEGRQAMRAAIVTGTVDSVTADGIASGDVPALDSEQHVHLWVFTPGSSGGFPEFNVPPGAVDVDGSIPPGTWAWPPRETPVTDGVPPAHRTGPTSAWLGDEPPVTGTLSAQPPKES